MPILSNVNSNSMIQVPKALESWLYYEQPLTDKLKMLSGDAELKLLSQDWVFSQFWDKDALDLEENIFQREIFMKSQGEVYWYARTIIPLSCYTIAPDFFKRLERESIRKLIFNEPKVQLVKRLVYSINDDSIEFQWMKRYLPTIQGTFGVRLAEFKFQEMGSFYLVEILFPKLGEVG